MNATETQPSVLVKVLVVVGFFATIGLLVWILILGARHLPSAFASLASLAEHLQSNTRPTELTIALEKSTVRSGESFTISWTDLRKSGTYTFAPLCIDGVSMSVRSESGDQVTIPCTETLSLPDTVHGLFLSVHSTSSRTIEAPFTISFESSDKKERVAKSTQVTIEPHKISPPPETHTSSETSTSEPSRVPEISSQEETSVIVTPPVQRTVSIPRVITSYPVSNPNGYTDLNVRFVGIGEIRGSSSYVTVAQYEEGERGAFRFGIKNTGTKTSESWTFTAKLPGDIIYTSKTQIPLRPNEEAILTLGFDVPRTSDNTTKIKISVDTERDTVQKNDTLTWSVKVRD